MVNGFSKRILFMGAPFFGYYKEIIKQFELLGYTVDYYNDRPSDNALIKGIIKIKKEVLGFLVEKYFDNIYRETYNNEYEMVFVLNCKVFNADMITKLKKRHRKAKFILYMWDSFELYPDSKALVDVFDEVYSFDKEDAKNILGVNFLPLFYSSEFEKIGEDNNQIKLYDILSVCTAHPNRYKIIRDLIPYLSRQGISFFSYLYIDKLQYFYNKVFVEEFKSAMWSEFEFSPLSACEIMALLRNSSVVLDIQHEKQSGLTMRTIETLGAKRKLITFNRNIKEYDFYCPENIFILTNDNWSELSSFLKQDYAEVSCEVYKKYSLENWVRQIISGILCKY